MSTKKPFKPTICFDFDGVIHSYLSRWYGPRIIEDPAVPGAIHCILRILETRRFQVAIHSSRSGYWFGRRAMKKWLIKEAGLCFVDDLQHPAVDDKWSLWHHCGFSTAMGTIEQEMDSAGHWLVRQINWPLYKPPAIMTIDDRAMQFQGSFPDIETIDQFQPWNKKYTTFKELSESIKKGL